MRARPLRAAVFALAVMGAARAVADTEIPADGIGWTTDIKEALGRSATSEKPTFVDVWAVWCSPCKKMEQTTYRDPAVVQQMEGFVALKVDQDVQLAFCDRHVVETLPTVLFLDGEGREITRLVGLLRSEQLLQAMGEVKAGYAGYLAAWSRPEDPRAASAAASYLLEVGNSRAGIDLLRRGLKASKDRPLAEREGLELELAELQLEAGEAGDAAGGFERLAARASAPEVRGRALQGLVRAQRERGKDEDAHRALERLRQEFPDLAAGLADGRP